MLASQDGEAWNVLKQFLRDLQSEYRATIDAPIKDIDKWNAENIRSNGAIDAIEKIINRLGDLRNKEE